MDFFEIAKEWASKTGKNNPSFKDELDMIQLERILMRELKDSSLVNSMMEYFHKNNSKPKINRRPKNVNNNSNDHDI
jgi:hypothetical protein